MKEIKPGLERLTSYPRASTLRSERSFMADEASAERKTESPPEFSTKAEKSRGSNPLSQAKIREWEEKTGVKWGETPLDLQKFWLETGVRPGPGATEKNLDAINRDDFQDARLKQLIEAFNSGFSARSGMPRSRFIENHINTINQQLLGGDINASEAQKLLNDLDQLLIEEQQKGLEGVDIADLFGGEKKESTQISELKRLLSDPAVSQALKNDKPDFSSNPLKSLADFIDKLDISNIGTYHEIVRTIANLKTEKHEGSKEDRQASEESRKLLFEWLYEKVIGRPDKGSPQAHYKIGSFQLLTLLDELDTLTLREFKDTEFSNYLSELQHVREVMHNLNIALKYGDQYKEFILTHLNSTGLSFVQNDMAGVNQVIAALEKVSANKVAESKEWFDQGDVKAIEDEVDSLFKSNLVSMEKDGRKLTDWERDRSLRLGKILFAGTQRMALYAAYGNLPPMAMTPERIASLPYEYITRSLMNFKVIAVRFFAGDKEAPKKFMQMVLDEWGKIPKGKDGKPKPDAYIRLFGLDRRTNILNNGQVQDPQSHSWRLQEMFFDPVRFTVDGKERSLLQHVSELIKSYEPISADPLLGAVNLSDEDKKDLSTKLRDIILGQRLYLSVFPRYSNFDNKLKAEIWKKVALLKPSTIASLIPLDMSNTDQTKWKEFMSETDKKVWKSLRLKLYAAELKRVAHDAEVYKGPKSLDDLKQEREAFENALKIADSPSAWTQDQAKAILNYMNVGEFKDEELTLLEKIVKHGIKNADKLAIAKLPFTLAIDDAPKVAWAKTGMGNGGLSDADIIRLLASDQASISEGWGAINGFVENPTHGAIESIQKAVEKIGSVHGRGTAQEAMEPFIVAYLKFVSTDQNVLWTPGKKTLNRVFNKATSEIERYYRNSYLSMNEEDKKQFLQALSQAGAISDNVTKDEAITQLDKIRKETKSSQAWVFLMWIRTIIFLFGPVAGKEFLKMLVPAFSMK